MAELAKFRKPYYNAQEMVDSGGGLVGAARGALGSIGNAVAPATSAVADFFTPGNIQNKVDATAGAFNKQFQENVAPRTAMWNATATQPAGSIVQPTPPLPPPRATLTAAPRPTAPPITTPRRSFKAPWDGNPSSHTEAPVIPTATNQLGEAWAPIEGEPKLSTMSSGGFRALNPGGIKAMDAPAGGGYAEANGQVFRLRGATPEELAANKAADAAYVPPTTDPNAIVQTIGTANGVQQLRAGEESAPDIGSMTPSQLMSFRQGQANKAMASNQSYRASLARQAEVTSAATMAKLPGDLQHTQAQINDLGVKQGIEERKLGMEGKKLDGLLQTWKSSAALDDAKAGEIASEIKYKTAVLAASMKGTKGARLSPEKSFEGRKGAADIAAKMLAADPSFMADKDEASKKVRLKAKTDEIFEGMLEAAAAIETAGDTAEPAAPSARKSLKQIDPAAFNELMKKANNGDAEAARILAKNARAIY